MQWEIMKKGVIYYSLKKNRIKINKMPYLAQNENIVVVVYLILER